MTYGPNTQEQIENGAEPDEFAEDFNLSNRDINMG
jgi:hypothetical protein